MKPNFICIGAQKAGTTWLHHNLQEHPNIWLPPYKELHYFDQIHLGIDKGKTIGRNQLIILKNKINQALERNNVNYSYLSFLSKLALTEAKDDQWYLSLFKDAEGYPAVGEITPGYSALPDVGVKHMKELLGDIRIIFILRNPIKRAWSQAIMGKRSALRKNKHVTDEQWIKITESKYNLLKGDQLRTIDLYEKYFLPENILYLFYDEICLSPIQLLKKVCIFLGVNDGALDFKQATIDAGFNVNPVVAIPTKVEQHLACQYGEQIKQIIQRFNPMSFEL